MITLHAHGTHCSWLEFVDEYCFSAQVHARGSYSVSPFSTPSAFRVIFAASFEMVPPQCMLRAYDICDDIGQMLQVFEILDQERYARGPNDVVNCTIVCVVSTHFADRR